MNSRIHTDLRGRRSGFTLIELIFVVIIIGVLLAMLLPSVRSSSGAARRMSCANNFKQIGLALHNYHSTHKQLPSAMAGTAGNANRLSGLVALLPFLEQQELWEQISMPTESNGVSFPAMGPAPWDQQYSPWQTEVPTYRCPSDPSTAGLWGKNNYAFCIGDSARQIHQPEVQRGVFACGKTSQLKNILDGLANTIAMGEIGTAVDSSIVGQVAIRQPLGMLENPQSCRDLGDPEKPSYYASVLPLHDLGRGSRWADGAAPFSLFATILPPNDPSCAVGGNDDADGIYTVGSYHQGGGHVLMADGAVVFITDGIEVGDSTAPTPSVFRTVEQASSVSSPYGLWGALGTSNGAEEIDERY